MSEQKIPGNQDGRSFRVKIAALVTGINVILTFIKFILYFFSGSMAILAEAWHSFSDIATSILVLAALLKETRLNGPEDTLPSGKNGKNRTESIISLGIGVMLTIVAGSLIFKFITAESQPIENSLVSGLIFLAFSFVSYFIYRFETQVGEDVNSIGLISDGMHSRADMVASLVTGFALILYTVGLNLDRWVSLFIALFVLAFAVETITNVVMDFFRVEKDSIHRYRFSRVFFVLFNKDAFYEKSKGVRSFIEKRFKFTGLTKIIQRTLLVLVPAAVIAVLLSSVFFMVGINEKAVVERFGRPVNTNKPIEPGLHIKWPWPVDRAVKVDASTIKSMNIGNIVSDQSLALLWTKGHGTEETFLTGDNNFFYPYIVVHYKIKEVFQYLYKNLDPEKTVNETAHQIATHLFSRQKFYDIASTNRERLEKEMFESLSARLDELEAGIEIISVHFKDIHPPISVADSFEKVIAGYQDKQRIINEALGYQYNTIPASRGNAVKETEAAGGYITERINTAEGDSSRFIMSVPSSNLEKKVAMIRIRLETIREALKDKKNIVVDPKVGTADIWMDFDTLIPKDDGQDDEKDNKKDTEKEED
ncbi:MAG: protease modulator HflK family protein [Deltaproteobacteria bacterium]|nr:protease modulator HflK family protein [Deltaproteobacteria bacterium]